MRVLFVCIQNAGRSRMAEGFARAAGLQARSAGSAPAAAAHPVVVQAMDEVGIDVGSRAPRTLVAADVEWADLVVTMGCGDACPVLPDTAFRDWQLPDPAGMDIGAVRKVRDEVARRVQALAAEHAAPGTNPPTG